MMSLRVACPLSGNVFGSCIAVLSAAATAAAPSRKVLGESMVGKTKNIASKSGPAICCRSAARRESVGCESWLRSRLAPLPQEQNLRGPL